ncbi:hypothetical protein PG996_013298 [Apiospora saccharicola]|uniref:Vegetative cell wall protein gp1 n=1 Tax=Apiospora saccharicola TaxID=335842 RepID=A0ABR1U536_9PEZI
MSYGSPLYGSAHPADYNYYSGSPSPTPSPRHNFYYAQPQTPQRPQTRAHFRNGSSGQTEYRTTFSPRYKSTGEYATGPGLNVSSRKHSFSKGSNIPPRHERRSSYSYYRTSHGDSDEDEVFEVDGITYVLPAQSRSQRHHDHYYNAAGGQGTDYHYYKQGPAYEKERTAYYDDPVQRSATRLGSHPRRASTNVPPPRSSTARPSSSHAKKVPPTAPKATEEDARKHRIPAGYSLKNWDPTEEPIMLLGSVFDSNSLGKWIYDWTVHVHGPVKRSEECVPKIRTQENKEMVEDFIESGERLTDKLRVLLKRCEAPMLKVNKRKDASQLGKNAGVEFVETLFGRERELEKTERYMQSVRLWNLRFDANCEVILRKPTM